MNLRVTAALATLLAMAALLPSAAPVEAQDATSTLVSNTGQTALSTRTSVSSHWIGTAFTTGSHAGGYTLSEVDLQIGAWQGNSAFFTANIYSASSAGVPDSQLCTLTNPGSPADNAVNTFTAPTAAGSMCPTLDASTTYALVVKSSSSSKTVSVASTNSDNEDGGAATGWSIADRRAHSNNSGTSWNRDARVLMFAVKGAEAAAPPGPEVSSAAVNGNTLEIVFDEDLNPAQKPAADAFYVASKGQPLTITSVGIADATVTLTLSAAVGPTSTIYVYYRQPSTKALQNAAGHKTASFSRQAVTNNSGTGTPSISSVALVSVPRRDTGNDGSKETYPRGQTIVVEVTWDQDVAWDTSAENAELRMRLQVGSSQRLAKLVTGGATSGTARSLWFSYTVVQGDADANGIAVNATNAGDLVILRNGATLKNAAGTQNASRAHAALGTQAGHTVDGTQTTPANTAPTYDLDESPGTINAPTGTLVQDDVPFSDPDGDPLRITMSYANDVFTLGSPKYVGGRVFVATRPGCVLANLPGATNTPHAENTGSHSEVITVTATDTEGASVSETLTTVTEYVCALFQSAEVNGKTLTLTFDRAPAAASWAPADEVLAAGEFTIMAGTAVVAVEVVAISGATATLTLAEPVAIGATVTASYAPGDYPAAVAFANQTVTNNTVRLGVQSAEAAYADGVTTLTLTFDRDLAAVGAPEPWDLRYAFDADGLWSDGNRYINMAPNLIETNGPALTLSYYAGAALPGREVEVRYDAAFAKKHFPPQLLYADGESVASFTQAMTRPDGGAAIAPVLESAQVAGNELTLTFDRALDASSTPAGSRFRVTYLPVDWGGASSSVDGTGTATISGSTVTVTLPSKVPQDQFTRAAYFKGDDAKPLRGVSSGPKVADIWWRNIVSLDRDAPQLTGSLLAGTSLVLYYGDTLDTGSTPATGSYTVNAGSTTFTVSGVSVHANAVELTLGSAPSGNVTVTYTPPGTNPVQDAAGNDAAELTSLSVSRQASDPGAASFSSASAAATALTVSFSQNLDPAHVPPASAFTLALSNADLATAGYRAPAVTGVAVLGTDVELTMSPWWYPCDGSLNVTYAKPAAAASRLQNNWGSEVDAFSDETAANTGTDQCVFPAVEAFVPHESGPRVQSGPGPRALGRTTQSPADASGRRGLVSSQPSRLNDGSQQPAEDASENAARLGLRFERALSRSSVPGKGAFTVTTQRPGAAPIEVTDVEMPDSADNQLLLSLSRHLAGGERVTVSYRRPHGTPGLWDAQGNQVADFSVEVTAPGGGPVFNGVAQRQDNALPGLLVSVPLSQSDFSDPDGDPLTFTLSASRDDVYATGAGVPGGFTYNDRLGRVLFLAKTACALADLDPPDGDAYYTVITMTATDPDGATAQATATFRTDPAAFACPSLSSATANGAAVTLTFDAEPAPSYTEPSAHEFVVKADGVAVSVAGVSLADADAGSDSGNTIILTLTSPVSAGQTVTVSYAPADSPVVAAFADRPAANDTPYEPDQDLIADVKRYSKELTHGYDHVLRWMRVLMAFGVVEGMTAAEAQDMAEEYSADRWDPVVAELSALEADSDYEPDAGVVEAVEGYSKELTHGYDHVLRWMRVLKTFGAIADMTSTEAQGYADQYLAERWDPVVEELRKLEASTP